MSAMRAAAAARNERKRRASALEAPHARRRRAGRACMNGPGLRVSLVTRKGERIDTLQPSGRTTSEEYGAPWRAAIMESAVGQGLGNGRARFLQRFSGRQERA